METSEDRVSSEDSISENWELCSAVKVDVSEVSAVSGYKVLVVSHDSTASDVIHSLLKKLHMKEQNSQAFVIQAEFLSQTEIAVLQFEDCDKLMHAYSQFPKGSLSFYLRRKMEISEKLKKDADKASVNGHQLTIQRIRRSLEKLKRKSTAASGERPATGQSSTGQSAGQGGRSSDQERGEKKGTDHHTHMIKADELYKEPRREHRGRQGRPRKHHSDVTAPRSSEMKKLTSSESLNRTDKPRGHHNTSSSSSSISHNYNKTSSKQTASLHSESMYQFHGGGGGRGGGGGGGPGYKTSTLPQGGTMVSMDTDCMIFYDNTSDAGSIRSMPVQSTHHSNSTATRAHVMPHHHQHNAKSDFHLNKHSVMIDKPQKSSFRNLEDSGIDVKSPPQVNPQVVPQSQTNGEIGPQGGLSSTSHNNNNRDRSRAKVNSCDAEVMSAMTNSQNNYLSPTLSDTSPFSLSWGIEGHVKRSGSFSSMKSLPVNMYKDNSTPNSFTFETIDHRDDMRSKSQSCTNLTRTKVVRRRSLPPLDVSQEKLEQKKTSLSKRLARKINRYRENEKRYPVLPSPHSFTPQNTTPTGTKKPPDPADDMSLADMEVANILEGKPEHPTDSDVEDYLACVESVEPISPSKPKKTSSGKPKKETLPAQQPNGEEDPMEKSGYYRYRNSAKLERQQKQETEETPSQQEPLQKAEEMGKENPQPHNNKPKALNKFVDQSMKSFLHHCHDVNMVSKHDTLELHQAALHGVLPTSPPARANRTPDTSAHSPVKATESYGHMAMSPSGSYSARTSSNTHHSATRPTHLHSIPSPKRTGEKHEVSSPNSGVKPVPHHSLTRNSSQNSTKPSAYQSSNDPSFNNSANKPSVPSPSRSLPQNNSARSSLHQSPTRAMPQSPVKTSPSKSLMALSPNKFYDPNGNHSYRDSHGNVTTKTSGASSPTKATMPNSPLLAHNSTRASGYSSSSSHMISPDTHDGAGSQHYGSIETSSNENLRTMPTTVTHQSTTSITLTGSSNNSRNVKNVPTSAKYTVSDKSDSRSKVYGVELHKDGLKSKNKEEPPNHLQSHQQWQGSVQDNTDGVIKPSKLSDSNPKSEKYRVRNPNDTHAFNSSLDNHHNQLDGDFRKFLNSESHTDFETVKKSSSSGNIHNQSMGYRQTKSGVVVNNGKVLSQYSASYNSSVQDKGQTESGNTTNKPSDIYRASEMLPSSTITTTSSSKTGTAKTNRPIPSGIVTLPNADIVTKDQHSNTSSIQQDGIGSEVSSLGSKHPPPSLDGAGFGDEVVLHSLSLFSLVASHVLCSVYLEKAPGQAYGVRVRRGEFRLTREAWNSVEEGEGEVPVYIVVQVTEIQADSPAQASKGKLLPGDIIVEINGHSVLQSSDKVVRTLLEARCSLQLVVARPRHREEHPDTNDTIDILNLTFDNMDQIPAEVSTQPQEQYQAESSITSGQKPDRSKAYQTISDSRAAAYGGTTFVL